MPSQDRAVILLLSGTLAAINVACSRVNSLWRPNEPTEPVVTSVTPSPVATPPAKPEPAQTPTSQPQLNAEETYERALDAAFSAATIGQSAQSSSDWQLVISRWQEAIALLTEIPSQSKHHAIAQKKITEYKKHLDTAKQQATRPRPPLPPSQVIATAPRIILQPSSPSADETPNPSEPELDTEPETDSQTNPDTLQVFKAPIIRRVGQTPVIEVTFNGSQPFEMIVDTGSSGTVITQAMAKSLGVVPEGEVTADTASAKGVKLSTGKVQSIAVDGAVVEDVKVAIAGPNLDLGLLGQDFFGNYDLLIRQDVIEFHQRGLESQES